MKLVKSNQILNIFHRTNKSDDRLDIRCKRKRIATDNSRVSDLRNKNKVAFKLWKPVRETSFGEKIEIHFGHV